MDILNNKKKDFISDIDYHFDEIENDLYRVKIDNNRNFNLMRLFDNILTRIKLIKELILSEPKTYLNLIFAEMKELFKEAFGELDGFYIIISLKKNPKPDRMGLIKLSINKKLLKDEK